MEFSYNYEDIMRRLALNTQHYELATNNDEKDQRAYVSMVHFDLKTECDVPSFMIDMVQRFIPTTEEESHKIVFPLFVSRYARECAGADTMVKYFVRSMDGRLNKAITPKGETYYGNNGIILDENFSPLLLATAHILYDQAQRRVVTIGRTIHIHPNVFIDDTKVLNKSLARKGVAYYLSHRASSWDLDALPYKVEIDNCAQWFTKARKPSASKCSDKDFNNFLKDNIGDILRQIVDDSRSIF